MKVSILLPVYNVEKYIGRCADSLLRQSYKDLEIIFVNDCSPDHSIEKLRNVLSRYPNECNKVKIIAHERNKGLAATRITGLENATGDYVMFVDSDDWLAPDTVELCISKIKETGAEIIVFYPTVVYQKRSIKSPCLLYPNKEAYVKALIERKTMVGVCGKLYKKELFEKITPTFTPGINNGEDYSVSPRLAYVAKSISFIPKNLYFYNKQNEASFGGNYREEYLDQVIEAGKIVKDFFHDRDNGTYNRSINMAMLLIKSGCIQRCFCNAHLKHRRKEMCSLFKEDPIPHDVPLFDKVILKLSVYKQYGPIWLLCNLRHQVAKLVKGKK